MSDFANILAARVISRPEMREKRVERNMELFGRNRAEATIVDDAFVQATTEAARAIGAAVDSLAPPLVPDALALICEIVPDNVAILLDDVKGAILGMLRPTPGCDCEACQKVAALRAQLDEIETQCQNWRTH